MKHSLGRILVGLLTVHRHDGYAADHNKETKTDDGPNGDDRVGFEICRSGGRDRSAR